MVQILMYVHGLFSLESDIQVTTKRYKAFNKLIEHLSIVLSFCVLLQPTAIAMEREDWSQYFDQFNAKGTIVVVDQRSNIEQIFVFNNERANRRFSPASTFKIPHTLFALDTGAAVGKDQVFKWNGVKRPFAAHNKDQTLHSAFQFSTLWVYQILAKNIGEKHAKQYLKEINYGNADSASKGGDYWIDGNLAISANEQITFLKKLQQNTLPFQLEHQRLLIDIMVLEEGKEWVLRAKTGWQGSYGWWVGWVDWPTGPVFFALNIDTPNRLNDLYKRKAIVREILRSIKALPEKH